MFISEIEYKVKEDLIKQGLWPTTASKTHGGKENE